MDLRIAGVDEAGRGPLAGPVYAAAVILDPYKVPKGLADSKQLSAARRAELAGQIKQDALAWAIASVDVEEIDRLNILQATLRAMRNAVDLLTLPADEVLVDGNQVPLLSVPARAIVKGDQTVPAISAASILAKVSRDALMDDYHQRYPAFSFHRHKGYGTAQHLAEIKAFGFLEVHRKSFNPLKNWLQTTG